MAIIENFPYFQTNPLTLPSKRFFVGKSPMTQGDELILDLEAIVKIPHNLTPQVQTYGYIFQYPQKMKVLRSLLTDLVPFSSQDPANSDETSPEIHPNDQSLETIHCVHLGRKSLQFFCQKNIKHTNINPPSIRVDFDSQRSSAFHQSQPPSGGGSIHIIYNNITISIYIYHITYYPLPYHHTEQEDHIRLLNNSAFSGPPPLNNV